MKEQEVRGIVRGRTIVLSEDSPDLPDGLDVIVMPWRRPLTGAEIIARLRERPPVSKEDTDALLEAIKEGEREQRRLQSLTDSREEIHAG